MAYKRSRRPTDPFSILLAVLVIGMALTLGYQISLYHGGQAAPVAKQAPAPVRGDG